ncbi:hypothetical protein M9H77_18415 [Catharanthus roseus]|uniref:Uncharacterized protein n=1 Tax=Catharanthus roseus TaxID=4058 RepID=A0ACC0B7G0_CATRO|nr:hypothetical protein M9H77_18415 [Catharanthus roseus]
MSCTNSTKQTLKHVIKIYFNVNIAPSCQRSKDTCVKCHRRSVQVLFQTGYTYKWAWYARKFAIERCFSPSIDRFQYCRAVISVDGTHLRGPFKGVLLIESSKSWNWFLKYLREYVVKDRHIDPEKWTLLHDSGHRHRIMTINISEALKSMLKKARVLPLKALVELIFNKLVRYFHQHREEAQNCVHPFSTRIFDEFLQIEMKSKEHKVITYNPREGIYMVRSPIPISGTANNVYTLRMNNTSCNCRKWQTYTLPCSHALAICRENGTRVDTYVPKIYS